MIVATSTRKVATVGSVNHNKEFPLEVAEVRQCAQGQWRVIHSGLGLVVPNTHKEHSPCQGCAGSDRFRIFKDYEERGCWICGGGGDQQTGDGFSLLMHVYGWSFPETLKAIAEYLGLSSMNANERQRIRESAKRAQDKLAYEARKRTLRANSDSLLLDLVFAFENTIKARQGQRQAEHSSEELLTAARLLWALESNYRGLVHEGK